MKIAKVENLFLYICAFNSPLHFSGSINAFGTAI